MKYAIIHGRRFVRWLAESSTYPALKSNISRTFPATRKRQHIANQVRVKSLEYVPLVHNQSLQVDAVVQSSDTPHNVTILFPGVEYSETDTSSNVTFVAADGSSYSINPIPLASTTLRVRCTCMDFRFRFALWNFNDDSLVGDKPPLYVRKTETRPPANPAQTPGVCKHIIKVVDTLKTQGLIR